MCFVAVFGMGFFLSFLMLCNLGTDPCSFMNKSVSTRIGISFGNWTLAINAVMLLIVIFCDRKMLGFGTLFNMVLVGYYVDFFDWLWGKTIPATVFTEPLSRWCIFVVTLLLFIISAAVYINSDMGVAPYDALQSIISKKVTDKFPKVPKMAIRMDWDFSAILIGTMVGGVPIRGIILMAIFLGPAITLVGKFINKAR